jgi:pantoate--beta-alanine ligase
VVSIFVNPTQFAPHEDLDRYPRTFDKDVALLKLVGAHAVYAPSASDMYASNHATYVTVERLQDGLCGISRPHFFRGVATVVAKLFNAVQPDRAYFGQKDAQQCAVITRMVRDLDFPIEIVEMPIVREPDGLAMSSRNVYLSAAERRRALCLSRALRQGQAMLEAGERNAARVVEAVRAEMTEVEIDYVSLVDASEIRDVDVITSEIILAVAAKVGNTRLIDNIKFNPRRLTQPRKR